MVAVVVLVDVLVVLLARDRDQLLDRALAVRALADQRRALIILERAGHDLGRGSA